MSSYINPNPIGDYIFIWQYAFDSSHSSLNHHLIRKHIYFYYEVVLCRDHFRHGILGSWHSPFYIFFSKKIHVLMCRIPSLLVCPCQCNIVVLSSRSSSPPPALKPWVEPIWRLNSLVPGARTGPCSPRSRWGGEWARIVACLGFVDGWGETRTEQNLSVFDEERRCLRLGVQLEIVAAVGFWDQSDN